MSLNDKEIALELTKAFVDHLSVRAQSKDISQSHATPKHILNFYQEAFSVVSATEKSSKTKE